MKQIERTKKCPITSLSTSTNGNLQQQPSMCPMNDIFTTPEAELLFAVSSHAAIIFLGGLRLKVRVSVGVMVRVSKLLGSNYNPNLTLILFHNHNYIYEP